MELIDNINRLLGDDLKRTLKPGARLKVAASCFSMYAFEALKDELGTSYQNCRPLHCAQRVRSRRPASRSSLRR